MKPDIRLKNHFAVAYVALVSALGYAWFATGHTESQQSVLAILWAVAAIGLASYVPKLQAMPFWKAGTFFFPLGQFLAFDASVAAIVASHGHWALAIAYSVAAFRIFLPSGTETLSNCKTK